MSVRRKLTDDAVTRGVSALSLNQVLSTAPNPPINMLGWPEWSELSTMLWGTRESQGKVKELKVRLKEMSLQEYGRLRQLLDHVEREGGAQKELYVTYPPIPRTSTSPFNETLGGEGGKDTNQTVR